MSGLSSANADKHSRRPQGLPGPTNPFIEFRKEDIEQSIPDRFEQQVHQYPGRLAVKTRDHELTYDELDQAANRLAWAVLAQGGEGPEAVALLLEQNDWCIASVFGVLKSAKPYVPLDPSNPRVRLSYILADSQAQLIVTNNRNLSLARELAGDKIPLINVDELDTNSPSVRPPRTVTPDTLAYIMYTSGSTGQPKGVVDNHRNVLHEIMKYTNDFHICPDDRLTLIRAFSGVGASMDIFTALLTGAVLYPLNIHEEGLGKLADWMTEHDLTVYHSVPTVFRHFTSMLTGQEAFPALRLVRLGGEVVDARDVELYKVHFSDDCLFLNVLGTTETLTFRRSFIEKQTQLTESVVPVGYAMDDAEVLLLDDQGWEVGAEQVGEIAVRSRYMSPGYWRRPDLTHAVFSSDAGGGDKRVYRTGDLGRMLPDGCLIHLGRKDFQVKIRGYRVEVSEIEMALVASDHVKEATVVAYDNGDGDTRLVAYWVPDGEPVPTVSELRSTLARTLPSYMMPSVFVALDALPQTSTGKTDRRALPAPTQVRPALDKPFVAPLTPVEEILADIWAEVLHVERVGVHDDFLELGGNSLLATQLISRMRSTFKVELPLRCVFEARTVTAMVEALKLHEPAAGHVTTIARLRRGLDQASTSEIRAMLRDRSKTT